MNVADVMLLVLVGLGFAVGFLRGTVRALLAVGAWAVCFLLASYLRVPIGSWLATNGSLDAFYAQMLAFCAVFVALFIGVVLVIMFSRTPTSITGHPLIDDIVGGLVGGFAALLVAAGLVVILGSYYDVPNATSTVPLVQVGLLADVNRALATSGLAATIDDTVVRWVAFLLGPIIPSEILTAMA
jgi:uncharacterized membrane protein required for colicin V production